VIGLDGEILRQLLLDDYLQSVVVGPTVEIRGHDLQEQWIRTRTLALPKFVWRNLVHIPRILQVDAPVARIPDVEHEPALQFMLHVEVELLGIWNWRVIKRIVNTRPVQKVWGAGGIGWMDHGTRRWSRRKLEHGSRGVVEPAGRRPALPPSLCRCSDVLPSDDVIDSEAAANRPVLPRSPGKP